MRIFKLGRGASECSRSSFVWPDASVWLPSVLAKSKGKWGCFCQCHTMRTHGHGSTGGGRWWWDSCLHNPFWGSFPSPTSAVCGRSKVTKLLKQQGLSLTNPLGSVTGLPQSSTGCSFHLFLEPASITLFNTGDLQSCPKLLFPCPASLRHSWKKGGSGKMDLKTTNNEQQRKNGMLGIRMILNMVSGRWDVRFQLCCALVWPQADRSLVLCFIFAPVRDSFCLSAWSRSPEAALAFAVVWFATKISVLFEALVCTPETCTALILIEVCY